MLRIIIQTSDYGDAAHVGGQVVNKLKTFDVDLPEVEAHLRQYLDTTWEQRNFNRSVVGVEVLDRGETDWQHGRETDWRHGLAVTPKLMTHQYHGKIGIVRRINPKTAHAPESMMVELFYDSGEPLISDEPTSEWKTA